MDCSTPGFPPCPSLSPRVCSNSCTLMPSNHFILCHPLLLPSIFPSIRVFSSEEVLRIRWPKDWSFSFSISPSNEYSGLICFRIGWLDLLAVQGTLKSLLQHHSLKTSIEKTLKNRIQVSQTYRPFPVLLYGLVLNFRGKPLWPFSQVQCPLN